jgi:hypothetical protein
MASKQCNEKKVYSKCGDWQGVPEYDETGPIAPMNNKVYAIFQERYKFRGRLQ